MSSKNRLMDALFSHEGREHVNLKFFRGTGSNVSPDDLQSESASAIFQVDSEIVERRPTFGDADRKQSPVAKFISAA